MSVAFEILKSLSLGELRRLLTLKENLERIEELMQRRDGLLEEARLIQNQIDELIEQGTGGQRKKRAGPSVKSLCEEILRGRKVGLTAAEVKNAVLDKYPHRNNRTFYNQVFIALTRNDVFKKDREGRFTVVSKRKSKR